MVVEVRQLTQEISYDLKELLDRLDLCHVLRGGFEMLLFSPFKEDSCKEV
jgi:hypothetical protein